MESDWEFVLVLGSWFGVLKNLRTLGISPLTKNTRLLNYLHKYDQIKTNFIFLSIPGANLRTDQQGIFPLAHVVDVDYNDFDPNGRHDDRKERYLLVIDKQNNKNLNFIWNLPF